MKKLLKRKSDGKKFKVIGGYILDKKRLSKDINGSFLTLQDVDDPQYTVLYIWPYWAECDYEELEEET